jgi:amino acid transporter
MLWGSVQDDLQIMIFLIATSFVIGVIVFLFSKKKLLSLFVFSLLGNLSVYSTYAIGSLVFRLYNLKWLQNFSVNYWPIINLILLIILVSLFVKNAIKKKH